MSKPFHAQPAVPGRMDRSPRTAPPCSGQVERPRESAEIGPELERLDSTERSSHGSWTRLARPAGLVALAALVLPAQAVMLGAAQVQSALGQPLVAEIRVLDADSNSLSAAPASPALQQHYGELPMQPALGRVDVRLVHKRNGEQVLRVTSERPVHEPIVELLLRVEDRRGHIVRRLPLLLDPPSAAAPTRLAEAVTAPEGRGATPVRRAESVASATQAGKSSRGVAKRSGKRKRGPVKQARKSRSGAAPIQVATSRKRAPAGVAGQSAAVRTRAATTSQAPAASASALAAATTPRPAVASEPQTLTKRLATDPVAQPATDSALALATPPAADGAPNDAQSNVPAENLLAGAEPSSAAAGQAPAAPASVDTAAAEPAVADGSGPSMSANAATLAPVPGSAAADAPPAAAGAQTSSRTPVLGAAAALLAALLALGWHRRRRRQADAAGSADDAPAGADSLLFGALDTDSAPVSGKGGAAAGWGRPGQRPAEDFSSSAMQTHEEVDPLAEADVYLAYGRADQARAILEDALDRTPDHSGLHLKLAAIDLEQRDSRAFKDRARVLATLTGQQGAHWAETCRMGQSLDPDDPLYASGSQAGSLPEQGIQHRPATPVVLPGDPGPDSSWVEFSFSETPGDQEEITESATLSGSGSLPEPAEGAAATADHAVDLELFDACASEPAPQPAQAQALVDQHGPLEDFADTSRFAALPARIARVQDLLHAGAFEEARTEALELARLGTELKTQASALADLASESSQPVVLD